jgi:ribosomal protein S18 acetylase RimI-like enzyme
MGTSLARFKEYYARHGLTATMRRLRVALSRVLFANRMVVFYCDLAKQTLPPLATQSSFRIEPLHTETELSGQDLETMMSLWNPELGRRNINERFAKGATLWLVKSGNRLAGYGWSLDGRTIEPYYFPLGPGDAHLFDFHVFPEYRGQGINPFLVGYILHALAADCGGRAFIETAEWNEAQLHSLWKTAFRRLGWARSVTIFGHKFTSWTGGDDTEEAAQPTESRDKAPAMARSHEQ